MRKEELFQALNDVDEAFLDENVTEIKHSTGWITAVLSLAACAAVTAGLIHFIPKPARNINSFPEEEIKVSESETTVTTVAETVTDVSADWTDETVISEDYQIYVNYNDSDIMTKEDLKTPKTIKEIMAKESVPYLEICIDEKNGYISMLTANDSDSLPKVGVLTRTETGYDCQINGEQFFLQDISGYGLIFRSDKSIYEGISYEGRVLEPRNNADHLFQRIKDEEAESVSIAAPDGSVTLSSEAVSEFMEIFRNIGTYCKSLAYQSGEYQFTVTLKDGTVYEIEPTQSFLKIDGMVYHAEEASRKALAEFYQKYYLFDNAETNPETTTSAAVTKTANELVIESVATSGGMEPVHLPYTTTEGQTAPSPAVLPNVKDPQPQQIETRYTETTRTTTTTVTTTEPVTEVQEIPEYIQNLMYETSDGTVFAREEGDHIEIAVTNGYECEGKFADAMKYYPGKKYFVSMQVFSHKTITDITATLEQNGISVHNVRSYDGRFLAFITEEQLSALQQIENMGFLIDLASEADTVIPEAVNPYANWQRFYTETDGIIYAKSPVGEALMEPEPGQTLTENGDWGAENLMSARAFPGMRYAVWISIGEYLYDSTFSVSEEEKENIRNTFTIEGCTLAQAQQENNTSVLAYFQDLEQNPYKYKMIEQGERLASYGYEVLGYSKYFHRIYAVVTEEELKTLPVTDEIGYLVGSMVYQDENYFTIN